MPPDPPRCLLDNRPAKLKWSISKLGGSLNDQSIDYRSQASFRLAVGNLGTRVLSRRFFCAVSKLTKSLFWATTRSVALL